ncbi:unnamed protein product [Phytophthora fragariaefolia]|uniref:Unnamed protein product n=1 Tax=Phytophthora fragariaefolia TaxID=1490495 RepID=A0A9W6TPF4_9STRA|nr:unnamed protein product [Phytophthora fragariaefolia]
MTVISENEEYLSDLPRPDQPRLKEDCPANNDWDDPPEFRLGPGQRYGWWEEHNSDETTKVAMVHGAVNNCRTDVLLDSGASVSMMSLDLARRLKLRLKFCKQPRVSGLGGVPTIITATTEGKITLGPRVVYIMELWVANIGEGVDVLLGMNFMYSACVRLYGREGLVKLPDEETVLLAGRTADHMGRGLDLAVTPKTCLYLGPGESSVVRIDYGQKNTNSREVRKREERLAQLRRESEPPCVQTPEYQWPKKLLVRSPAGSAQVHMVQLQPRPNVEAEKSLAKTDVQLSETKISGTSAAEGTESWEAKLIEETGGSHEDSGSSGEILEDWDPVIILDKDSDSDDQTFYDAISHDGDDGDEYPQEVDKTESQTGTCSDRLQLPVRRLEKDVDQDVLEFLGLVPPKREESGSQFSALTDTVTVFQRYIPAPVSIGPVLGRSSYIDDIAHGAPIWDQLCDDLDVLLFRLHYWNISVSLPKSEFGKLSIPYLSHEISAEGIRAVPKTAQFVEDFPVVAAVLYELSDDQVRSERDLTSAKAAFEILKKMIVSTPLLRHPDRSKPLVIIPHANRWAACAVLGQAYDGKFQRIRFTGLVLNGADLRVEMLDDTYQGIVLSFDGAAKTSTRRGSCGCILWRLPGWKVLEARGFILDDVSVNDAEYNGLLKGAQMALNRQVENLVVVGDSRIVIQQVQGLVNCHPPNLQKNLAECAAQKERFRTLRLVHVKREYNQAADYLTSKTLTFGKSWIVQDPKELLHLERVSKIAEKLMKPKVVLLDGQPPQDSKRIGLPQRSVGGVADSQSAPLLHTARVFAVLTRSKTKARTRPSPEVVEDGPLDEEEPRRPMTPSEYQAERWRRIRVHQQQDIKLSEIKSFLKGDIGRFSPRRLRKISKVADLFALYARDVLYRLAHSARGRPRDVVDEPRLVVPDSLRSDVLHYAHEDFQGCVDRASGEGRPPIEGPSPGNIEPRRPYEVVSMDFVTHMPESERGNTFLLLFQDASSGFVMCMPMRATTAQNVAEVYEECVFRRFGASSMVRHDQDPSPLEFRNAPPSSDVGKSNGNTAMRSSVQKISGRRPNVNVGEAQTQKWKELSERQKSGFEKGDSVWLYIPKIQLSLSRKLAHMWHGPFRIEEMHDDFRFKLKLTDSGYRVNPWVHVGRFKPRALFPKCPTVEIEVAEDDDFDAALLLEDSWEPDSERTEYELEKLLSSGGPKGLELPDALGNTRSGGRVMTIQSCRRCLN